jgi:hypothetical protein
VIEDVLDCESLSKIKDDLSLQAEPTKSEIKRFFQEKLATNCIEPLGDKFEINARQMLESMRARLASIL